MSRWNELQEASKYIGLAAGHWACYGESWREVGDYRNRAEEILDGITLNEAEFFDCRRVAANRAERYIHKAFSMPGKTLIPRSEEEALRLAKADIDAMMQQYRPS